MLRVGAATRRRGTRIYSGIVNATGCSCPLLSFVELRSRTSPPVQNALSRVPSQWGNHYWRHPSILTEAITEENRRAGSIHRIPGVLFSIGISRRDRRVASCRIVFDTRQRHEYTKCLLDRTWRILKYCFLSKKVSRPIRMAPVNNQLSDIKYRGNNLSLYAISVLVI